jgi:hypothetical protein
VLVFPGNPSYNPTSFLWSPVNGGAGYGCRERGTLPAGLEGRRYMSIAIFWGRFDPATVKPSDASQHGRIYLATGVEPAAIVITPPNMAGAGGGPPDPVPVPTSLDAFCAGWTLKMDIVQWMRVQTDAALPLIDR